MGFLDFGVFNDYVFKSIDGTQTHPQLKSIVLNMGIYSPSLPKKGGRGVRY